jgi:hypothetical protein
MVKTVLVVKHFQAVLQALSTSLASGLVVESITQVQLAMDWL